MRRFATGREAKEFLVEKIVEEASREGVPLRADSVGCGEGGSSAVLILILFARRMEQGNAATFT
jgi:hypothetical protein